MKWAWEQRGLPREEMEEGFLRARGTLTDEQEDLGFKGIRLHRQGLGVERQQRAIGDVDEPGIGKDRRGSQPVARQLKIAHARGVEVERLGHGFPCQGALLPRLAQGTRAIGQEGIFSQGAAPCIGGQ